MIKKTVPYEVGYAKPPPLSRFKKGKSGNPKGRPRGAKNLITELEDELREPITVREGGVAKRISKRRAMIKRQVELALKGEPRALLCLFNLDRLHAGQADDADADLSADDQAIIARFLAKRPKPAGADER